jgi:hypothetical protein
VKETKTNMTALLNNATALKSVLTYHWHDGSKIGINSAYGLYSQSLKMFNGQMIEFQM